MTELHKKIIKYYDECQIFYDLFWMNKKNLAIHYGFWEKGTRNLHEALINENKAVAEKLDIKKSDIILDAGCGVGGTVIWVAENYGTKVVGINISEKQVELAKEYAKKRKIEHLVSFEVKDFCNTGFPDESFTKIFGLESICYAEEKEDFIREAFRLLKPGGILVVADGFLKRKNLNKEEQQILTEWYTGWALPNTGTTVSEFHEKLAKIGFKKIEFEDRTQEVLPSSRRIYLINMVLYPFVRILNLIKVLSDTNTLDIKASLNQYHIFKKQIGLYGIFSAQKL